VPAQKEEALLGMDLLRLGLERAATARQAVEVITSLLEQYGQGGQSGFLHPTYYHNSFLITDPQEAWVLETVERRWAARQVRGAASISNCLTIGSEFDLASPDLVSFAQSRGWVRKAGDFDFARDYSDLIYTTFGRGRQRCQRSQGLLKAKGGEATIRAVMTTLRDHGEKAEASFQPERGIFDYTICAHAGFGPVRATQTTGSLVAYLHPEHPVYFVTGSAAPCTSIFKPVWVDSGVPDTGPKPEGTFNPATLFWQHEQLHRATLADYERLIGFYRQERDEMERRFVQEALELADAPKGERAAFSARCFAQANAAACEWLRRVTQAAGESRSRGLYGSAWRQFNQQAKLS
jgi:dipeptidase